jgi:hypothetical protein
LSVVATIVSYIKIKERSSKMSLLNETELAYCDVCGNYVPTVEDEGDLFCAYEYAEYPDIANIVG